MADNPCSTCWHYDKPWFLDEHLARCSHPRKEWDFCQHERPENCQGKNWESKFADERREAWPYTHSTTPPPNTEGES